MKRIGLMSDTHSHLEESIFKYFEEVDEIWHAGDIGDIAIMDTLEAFKPCRAVYGNIDHGVVKHTYPRDMRFNCEGLDVFMTHIGGYPGRYNKRVFEEFIKNPPKLFICGHSHILKVMPDKQFGFLHINPGACGNHGFHAIKTITRFSVDEGKVKDLEVVELGQRGAIKKGSA